MNLREQLLLEHSRKNSQLIVRYLLQNRKDIKILINLFLNDTYSVSQRAGMAVSHLFDKDPQSINAYLPQIIDKLMDVQAGVAIRRNAVRILQSIGIPEKEQGKVYDRCLQLVGNPKETIAVKVFAMQVLLKICQKHPALVMEVIPLLEDTVSLSASAGIKSRGRKILQKLNKLSVS